MVDFASIAEEVFEVLLSFNYEVTLYNDEGMAVTEPEESRRMFDKNKNLMVSLVDDDDNSAVILTIGKHTHAADVMQLIQSLRSAATKYNVTFRVRNYNQDIDPKTFAHLASVTEARKKDIGMEVFEGMYGTSRSSYLRLENARMIVRHKRRIDDSKIGARGRCVETIFVENATGERFLMPTQHLAPARAMTQHINQGGAIGDTVGQQITEMAKDYANLMVATHHMGTGGLAEAVIAVREACKCKAHKLRKTFESLYRPSSYTSEAEAIIGRANMLVETDIKVDETRLSELRQILDHDDELDDEVYECVARAVDEAKAKDTIEEAMQPPAETVGVFDYRIDKRVYDDFAHGKLALKGHPTYDPHSFTSAVGELIYRLGQIVPLVKDDGMANLLGYVADQLVDADNKKDLVKIGLQALKATRGQFAEPQVKEQSVDLSTRTVDVMGQKVAASAWQALKSGTVKLNDRPKFDNRSFTNQTSSAIYRLGQLVPSLEDPTLQSLLVHVSDQLADAEVADKQPYMKIALRAIKAGEDAASQEQHELADRSEPIQEFQVWLEQFTAEKVLVEGLHPHPMDPDNPMHDIYDQALDSAVERFDPLTFIDSPTMKDIVDGRDPKNPDENEIEKSEVMSGLVHYMSDDVESMTGEYVEDRGAMEMAKAVYDRAVSELQSCGFIVHDNAMTEGVLDEELTREDVLLPPKNMGDDLAGEVTKTVVKDPDKKDHVEEPDSSYVSRLKVLAGMTSNANSQGY